MRNSKWTALVAAAALLAMPAAAWAHTTQGITETGGSVTVLPLLGSGLQVEVVLDESGNLSEVNLDPATGAVATEVEAHEVEFKLTDSSTEVSVEAEGDELAVEVETIALADLVGPGSWSADLFGTGEVTVSYEITETGGQPTITLGDVIVPDGVTFSIETEDEDDEAEITIEFISDGQVKTLEIGVESEGGEAELEISLEAEGLELDDDDDEPSLDDEALEFEDDDEPSEEDHQAPTVNVPVQDDDDPSDDAGDDDSS